MWAYIVRRLLWMIPTFIGILVINFAVVRLRGPTLAEELHRGGSGEEAGLRQADAHLTNVRNHLARFHLAGNHLPAVVNVRGFTSKNSVLRRLQRLERGPQAVLNEGQRSREELTLWLKGTLYVEPLIAILEDESLERFHGPASQALRLCAFDPPLPTDLQLLSEEQRRAKQQRNQAFDRLAIAYRNDPEFGFITEDPERDSKRAALLELYDAHRELYRRSPGRVVQAMVLETGFVDLMTKLFTGRLWSHSKGRSVFALIGERWQVTFTLNILAIIIAWSVSIPLGIRSARRAGSLGDAVTTNALFFLWSVPSFFLGSLFLHHLCTDSSTGIHLFPNAGLSSPDSHWLSPPRLLLDYLWHGFLPLLLLTYGSFTALSRYMRAQLLDQLHADYIRTARAKGCDEDRIIYRHALRNSMVTMVTLGQGLLSALYGGFLFTEIIFSINGLGTLLYDAALDGDAPLLMGSTLISVGLFLFSILVADIMYAVVDPRIRSRYV